MDRNLFGTILSETSTYTEFWLQMLPTEIRQNVTIAIVSSCEVTLCQQQSVSQTEVRCQQL